MFSAAVVPAASQTAAVSVTCSAARWAVAAAAGGLGGILGGLSEVAQRAAH